MPKSNLGLYITLDPTCDFLQTNTDFLVCVCVSFILQSRHTILAEVALPLLIKGGFFFVFVLKFGFVEPLLII